jgi:ubiquitin-conjugating enzyme E2 variant
MSIEAIVGQSVLGWLLADAVGGVVHYVEDKQLLPDFLDKHVGVPNRLHHSDPLSVTRNQSVLGRNSTTIAATLPFIVGLYFVTGFSAFWLSASVGGLLSYEVHRWSHMPRKAPRFVRMLQEIGIFQSPKHHAGHHRPGQERDYCILTNYVNPVINYFRRDV